ncbi:MAG: hypothetical protein WD801_02150 [Gemmatimonadaceae bacterium]
MSRPTWIAPLYGYLVCVIAVVTFLVNVSGFVDAMFDRANPLAGRGAYGPNGGSLTSFESFSATYESQRPPPTSTRARLEPAAPADTLTTAQMRTRYEALRADAIQQTRHQAMQKLVKSGLLILLSVVLFAFHWTWVRRQRDT